ncbi:MAG: Mov34/MPN/PAD-1 family protein [Planctomycetota bacterium]|nr:Mov34/MPN/PAD-1 family protein [Planctomycetota bacterium]MDA1166470.1 Mov34/MPN/PAD-1 family protein [Planctomycetota bacterium]
MENSAEQLFEDSAIRRALRDALLESRSGTKQPIEQGGFIVRDASTLRPVVRRLSAGLADSFQIPLCPDGQFRGEQILGSFHTHPNTGPEWQEEPSRQDIRLVTEYPETIGPWHFVIGPVRTYCIGNDGTVKVLGVTDDVLQIDSEDQS